MQRKPIHIISFDNPYPPIYGGAIDVFFKLRALHSLGFEIYLHCFADEIPSDFKPLEQFAFKVYFYERKKKGQHLLSRSPFSVASRYDELLAENISAVEAPLLFEGLQSTYILQKHRFPNRKIFLRLMNLESNYFGGLRKSEKFWFKKILFGIEAIKYSFYQKTIKKFDKVFTLSVYETKYVNNHFGNAQYVPVFHGNDTVSNLSDFGKYALYHGDLRMADNRRAALFLIEVFRKIPDYQLIIASNRGKRLVKSAIENIPNISHTHIDNQNHLDDLMHNAHISVMFSFQQSGTKLKSINSLYKSRHCIINKNMVDDVQLLALCTLAETKTEFINAVNTMKNQPYADYEKRKKVLGEVLNDIANAEKITKSILFLD